MVVKITSATTTTTKTASGTRQARRAASVNAMDAVMMLISFSDLRIRGPEVQPVCFKGCVVIATHQKHNASESLSAAMIGEVIVALASLQARRIPLLKKALLPRLLELNADEHNERFVQRVGFALVKLGAENADSAVTNHILSLLLEYITVYNPTDRVALVTATAVASMKGSRVASLIIDMASPHADGDQRERRQQLRRKHLQRACAKFYTATVATAGQAAPVELLKRAVDCLLGQNSLGAEGVAEGLAFEAAVVILLVMVHELNRLGAVAGAVGNSVFQLLHVWVPLSVVYREVLTLHRAAQHDVGHAAERPSLCGEETLAVKTAIQRFVKDLSLTKCVPGGFASFMHDSLLFLTSSSSTSSEFLTSIPFIRRLLSAAADPTFAKAFNSYDIAKLADALRQGAWDSWLSVTISTSESTQPSPSMNTKAPPAANHVSGGNGSLVPVQALATLTKAARTAQSIGTLADALLAVTGRLTEDLEFFAKNRKGPSCDSVAFCAVLRAQLRLLQGIAGGSATAKVLSHARRTVLSKALQVQMAQICRACVLSDVRDGGSAWALNSIPWAMQMICSILAFSCRALRPRLLVCEESTDVMLRSVTTLANLFSGHLEALQQPMDGAGDIGIRDAVVALHVSATMMNLLRPDPTRASEAELSVADTQARASFARMASLALETPHQWSSRTAEDWNYLPATERSMVLHSIGLLSFVPMQQQPSDEEGGAVVPNYFGGAFERVRKLIGGMGDSFLRSVVSQQGLPSYATPPSRDETTDEVGEQNCSEIDAADVSPTSTSTVDPVFIIDALCAVFSWIGCSEGSSSTSPAEDAARVSSHRSMSAGRNSAVRTLFSQLLEAPCHSLPPSALIRLLDSIVSHRHVLLSQNFHPSSSLVLLRSDVKLLWERQKYSIVSASTAQHRRLNHLSAEASSPDPATSHHEQWLDRAASVPPRSMLHGHHQPMSLVVRAAANLQALGFILVASESSDDATKEDLPRRDAKKRRVFLPIAAATTIGTADVSPVAMDEVVELAALVVDQRARFLPDEWTSWGSALSPAIARGVHLLSARGVVTLLRALRFPESMTLLLPRNVDRTQLVLRSHEHVDAVATLSTQTECSPEALEIAQGFAAAPHLEGLLLTVGGSTTVGSLETPRLVQLVREISKN